MRLITTLLLVLCSGTAFGSTPLTNIAFGEWEGMRFRKCVVQATKDQIFDRLLGYPVPKIYTVHGPELSSYKHGVYFEARLHIGVDFGRDGMIGYYYLRVYSLDNVNGWRPFNQHKDLFSALVSPTATLETSSSSEVVGNVDISTCKGT